MEETLGLWREAHAAPPKTLCSLYPSMLCWDIGLVEKVRKSAQVGSEAESGFPSFGGAPGAFPGTAGDDEHV